MPITFTHPATREAITISLKPESVVISPRFAESYSFDRAGRLLSLFLDDRSMQRTLDHRLLLRQKDVYENHGERRRIELTIAKRDSILKRVFATLNALALALPQANLPPQQKFDVHEAFSTILDMGPDTLAEDGEKYRRLLLPVSILPPDQYLALVVQATEGCSWNRCAFCGLYRDRKFRIRGVNEFRAHCEAMRDFFGAGLSLRKGLFLADANALVTPQARLLELLRVAQEVFGQPENPRPLFSFITAFDAQRKSADDWTALRELGLTRVYIGLETGDDELLRFVDKPGTAAQVVQTVCDLKAVGISVGVIAMIGLGGDRYAAQHEAHTIEVIRAMPLDRQDVIYLSAYRPAPHTPYPAQAEAAGIRPLTHEEEKTQRQAIQGALRAHFPDTRVAPYQVDGFAL